MGPTLSSFHFTKAITLPDTRITKVTETVEKIVLLVLKYVCEKKK